jgi:hypothetical protein
MERVSQRFFEVKIIQEQDRQEAALFMGLLTHGKRGSFQL